MAWKTVTQWFTLREVSSFASPMQNERTIQIRFISDSFEEDSNPVTCGEFELMGTTHSFIPEPSMKFEFGAGALENS